MQYPGIPSELSTLQTARNHIMQMKYVRTNPANAANPLRKFVTFLATLVVFGLVLMFSAVLFAVILVFGLIAWGFFWWKTRQLRKHLRDLQAAESVPDSEMETGNVIEGEVIRVDITQREQ